MAWGSSGFFIYIYSNFKMKSIKGREKKDIMHQNEIFFSLPVFAAFAFDAIKIISRVKKSSNKKMQVYQMKFFMN